MRRLTKWTLFINIVYSLIYSLWLQHRPVIPAESITPIEGTIFHILFQMGMVIPFFAFVPLFAQETKKENLISLIWKGLAKYSVQIGLGITVTCLILEIFKVPGIWWSWASFGLMASMMSLLIALLESKMPKGEALVLAVGTFSFVDGLWEIPYQWLNAIYGGLKGTQLHMTISHETLIQIPILLGGLFIIWFYTKKYRLYHFSGTSVLFLLLYFSAWAFWIGMGFYLDWIYNGQQWVYNTPVSTTYVQSIAAKGSKVLLNFTMLSVLGGFTLNHVKRLFSR